MDRNVEFILGASPVLRTKLDPQLCYPPHISSSQQRLDLTHSNVYRRTGGKTGKTFGIPCRSVLKIAEADSTSVFSGFFPVLLEHAVPWVKFSPSDRGPGYPLQFLSPAGVPCGASGISASIPCAFWLSETSISKAEPKFPHNTDRNTALPVKRWPPGSWAAPPVQAGFPLPCPSKSCSNFEQLLMFLLHHLYEYDSLCHKIAVWGLPRRRGLASSFRRRPGLLALPVHPAGFLRANPLSLPW
jgi:hypothetical protein